MAAFDEPSSADRPQDVSDPVAEDDLERVMRQVPRGTLALAGLALLFLVLCWLLVYFGVFIPRGPVS